MKLLFVCLKLLGLVLILLLTTKMTKSATNWITECKEVRHYADFTQRFLSSPHWPQKYPNNLDCYHEIHATKKLKVDKTIILQLEWRSFDIKGQLGSCSDFIKININQKKKTNFTFCSNTRPHTIFSTERRIRLHFHSDNENNGYGFQIAYKLVRKIDKVISSECGTEVSIDGQDGVISSPNWPELRSPCSSIFRFTLADNETLFLNIMDFSMKTSKLCNIYSNYLELRGSSKRKSRFHDSCSLFATSICDSQKIWSLKMKKKTLYLHLSFLDVRNRSRGALIGFMKYQTSSKSRVIGRKFKKIDIIIIGAITGILMGLLIVFLTSVGTSLCIKKGMI